MKFGWIKEEALIACDIVHYGIKRRLALHHLSGADMDEADRRYPIVPGAATSEIERTVESRFSFIACRALGPEAFDATDIDGQMHELLHAPDRLSGASINLIVSAAFKASSLTPEMLEAAQKSVNPFESPAADAPKGE